MIIRIVTPAPRGSQHGNRVTAERYARLLRQLGHRVSLATDWRGERCDVLVAVHARKCGRAALRFARTGRPLVVVLAGTDLYPRLSKLALRALEAATRIVTLQPAALDRLPPALRGKATAILQSAIVPRARPTGGFVVCVLGHLRPVKDPFRAALAIRRLPGVRLVHAGAARVPAMARRARAEEARNPRYRWVGELSHAASLRLLGRSRLLVLTSRNEGGANVIAEALVAGVPVVSSRIDGSVGMLGKRYPGYFPVGDTAALRALLERCQSDPDFLRRLARFCARLAPRHAPERERAAWKRLLGSMVRPARIR